MPNEQQFIYFEAQTGIIRYHPPAVSNFHNYRVLESHKEALERAVAAADLGTGGITYSREFIHTLELWEKQARMVKSAVPSVEVDGAAVDFSGLPESKRDTCRFYLEGGCDPGFSIRLVLQRDLMAILAVEDETLAVLPQIVKWLHNHAPGHSWGSAEKVKMWMSFRQAATGTADPSCRICKEPRNYSLDMVLQPLCYRCATQQPQGGSL